MNSSIAFQQDWNLSWDQSWEEVWAMLTAGKGAAYWRIQWQVSNDCDQSDNLLNNIQEPHPL